MHVIYIYVHLLNLYIIYIYIIISYNSIYFTGGIKVRNYIHPSYLISQIASQMTKGPATSPMAVIPTMAAKKAGWSNENGSNDTPLKSNIILCTDSTQYKNR